MSNLNLQKLREWVWPCPWTFNTYTRYWLEVDSASVSAPNLMLNVFSNIKQRLALYILTGSVMCSQLKWKEYVTGPEGKW